MALPLVLLTASLLAGAPAAAGTDQATEARRLYNQSLYELAIKSASDARVQIFSCTFFKAKALSANFGNSRCKTCNRSDPFFGWEDRDWRCPVTGAPARLTAVTKSRSKTRKTLTFIVRRHRTSIPFDRMCQHVRVMRHFKSSLCLCVSVSSVLSVCHRYD